ncbi:MAG: amino acid adenylation domain-containing protein, partial [bacterium]|nr:amino acid adenylation domain-containing protein [bacterium]
PAEKKEHYPLSPAQTRLYVLHQLAPHSTAYNMPQSIPLDGGTADKKKLASVFQKLIRRHESLRTSFHQLDGPTHTGGNPPAGKGSRPHEVEYPVQVIHPISEIQLEYYTINTQQADTREEESTFVRVAQDFVRPFDLTRTPLLRAGMITCGELHVLMVDIHHIICDGLSLKLLAREFSALYQNETLPELTLQYKDYSQWTMGNTADGRNDTFRRQEKYWLNRFKNPVPVLNLPTDFPRPSHYIHEGAAESFVLDGRRATQLKDLAEKEKTTSYILFLSLLTVLMAKLSSDEDIVVGTPVAGRGHSDLEGIIGMFVNTLPLNNYPSPEKNFSSFLQEVKTSTLAAFDNQDYPFEKMVEKIVTQRDTSRNPLFDINFTMHTGLHEITEESTENSLENDRDHLPEEPFFQQHTAKFDLTLTAIEEREQLFLVFEYASRLFKKSTIRRFFNNFSQLISSVIQDPATPISHLDIFSPGEKEQLLETFNRTEVPYPDATTIHRLIEAVAGQSAQDIAVENEEQSLTYGELNCKANALAHHLREEGVSAGSIVGILATPSIEAVIGILGILKAGAAYLPLDPQYPEDRIAYMMQDSGMEIILTNSPIEAKKGKGKFRNLTAPEIYSSRRDNPQHPDDSRNSAYIIYTSGSTGKPKGVIVEHGGLVNYINWVSNSYVAREHLSFPLYTSLSFDLTVTSIFTPLVTGNKIVIYDGEHRHSQIESIIRDNRVGIIKATPAHLKLIRDQEWPESSLKAFIVGGEELETGLADQILENFNHKIDIFNEYGPTETVVGCTMYRYVQGEPLKETLPIGTPAANTQIYILDGNSQPQPVGVVGEIHIAGHGVATGYLNRPELTHQRFPVNPFIPSHNEAPRMYRSGDLGRRLEDGTIEFLGRCDNQVKIRGYRIELGEIECRLLEQEEVKDAVVIVRQEKETGTSMNAFVVLKDKSQTNRSSVALSLKDSLSRLLPEYMVPTHITVIDFIPLTAHGKVNREALPKPVLTRSEPATAPRNDIERKLQAIWTDILDITAPEADPHTAVGIDDNFFQLGGHSLKATVLLSRVHRDLEVKIPLAEVFKSPTIRGLAKYVQKAAVVTFSHIPPAETKEYYPVSSAQKRIYVLQQLAPHSTVYNMPMSFPIIGKPDIPRLEKTFNRLIQRHESLRTSFHILGAQTVQKIHAYDPSPFDGTPFPRGGISFKVRLPDDRSETFPGSEQSPDSSIQPFIRPFDLSTAPLLRASLLELEDDNFLLLVDTHHIISDGVSHAILQQDFQALYKNEKLPPLHLHYKDFSQWQAAKTASHDRQREYWLGIYKDQVPQLDLPMDYPRPKIQDFQGAALDFQVPTDTANALRTLSHRPESTLFMTLMAVFNIVLSKLGRREDIVVGTPVAARRHADMDKIIGMFVNTLAVRNFPAAHLPFTTFLQQLKKHTLDAFENQEYPFEDLVDQLSLPRDASRNPLFDVLFTLNTPNENNTHSGGETGDTATAEENNELSPEHRDVLENRISKFDLALIGTDTGNQLFLTYQYSTRLFKPGSIKRFNAYFLNLLETILADPATELAEMEIISRQEKSDILQTFNGPPTYTVCKSIPQLFEEAAAREPDSIAVVADGQKVLTYRRLNARVNQLAHYLLSRLPSPRGGTPVTREGAPRNFNIGLLFEGTTKMIIAILAVLKAGCTYVPLDPRAPLNRKKFILHEVGAELLLTVSDLAGEMETIVECLHLDTEPHSITFPEQPPIKEYDTKNNAYIIFTSGSTGKPKGVPITHANLSPLLHWGYRHLGIAPRNRTLRNLSYYFDWSAWEVFITLTAGAALYMASRDILLDPDACNRYIRENAITILHATPTQFGHLIREGQQLPSLEYLFIGAEKLTAHLVRQSFQAVTPACRLFNMYGPTEATIISAVLEIPPDTFDQWQSLSSIPIGTAVGNTGLLVLDNHFKLCPVNVPGQLYISGDGLSAGYLSDPEKTAASFISNMYQKEGLHGDRMYKTGDLVRLLQDGNIEFIGRIDHQVKIRGYRIEPGEIARALLEHHSIEDALVIPREDTDGELFLCAYIITTDIWNNAKPGNLEITQLKEFLALSLPAYMIPSHFITIDTVPLNPNGKVDIKALPEPSIGSGTEAAPPRDAMERKLVEIWKQVLAGKEPLRETVGIHDDFFQLGGHSLKAALAVSEIRKQLEVDVPMVQLFSEPTIQATAQYIRREKNHYHPPGDENLLLLKSAPADAPNLFLIHDGTGEVDAYIEFCGKLDSPFNCWGIRADRWAQHGPRDISINTVAQQYVEKIKKLQPQGPYILSGWSIGGTIAFEIALQLEASGNRIHFLALVDSPPPGNDSTKDTGPYTVQMEKEWLQTYLQPGQLPGADVTCVHRLWEEVAEYLKRTGTTPETLRQFILETEAVVVPHHENTSIPDMIKYLNIGRSFRAARFRYIPQEKIETPVLYFGAAQSDEIPKHQWQQFVKNSIDYYETPGDHISIFQSPDVNTFVRRFQQAVLKKI